MNVEIYVLQPNDADVFQWVETRIGIPELANETDDIRIYHASFAGAQVALTITPRMEGGDFTSLFFSGPRLPWETDAECARDAARSQRAVVRCVPEGLHREDEWLEVSAEGERLVRWEDV
jgi:hypothetical protein